MPPLVVFAVIITYGRKITKLTIAIRMGEWNIDVLLANVECSNTSLSI